MWKKEGTIRGNLILVLTLLLPTPPPPTCLPPTAAESPKGALLAWRLPPAPPAHPHGQAPPGALTSILSRAGAQAAQGGGGPKPACPDPRKGCRVAGDSRSILVASVEHQERVRLPKEIFLVQLVGTELHCGNILRGGSRGVRRRLEAPQSLWKYSSGPRNRRTLGTSY